MNYLSGKEWNVHTSRWRYVFKWATAWKVQGRKLDANVKMPLGLPAYMYEHLALSPSLAFDFSLLFIHTLGSSKWQLRCLGPCHPCGRPRLTSRLWLWWGLFWGVNQHACLLCLKQNLQKVFLKSEITELWSSNQVEMAVLAEVSTSVRRCQQGNWYPGGSSHFQE